MKHRIGRRAALLASVALVLLVAPSVVATHSLPATPTYQDAGNDGDADATTTVRTAGDDSYWTATREDRVTGAAAQWRVYSQFKPTANLSAAPADCYDSWTCHGVWIDGQSGGVAFGQFELAHNMVLLIGRTHPVTQSFYYDVEDWDIFFHTSGSGHPAWTYSLTHPGDPDVYDFQGVLTHELGHAILLDDLYGGDCNYGTGMYTMCGAVDGYPDSYRYRSITNDDIAAAGVPY